METARNALDDDDIIRVCGDLKSLAESERKKACDDARLAESKDKYFGEPHPKNSAYLKSQSEAHDRRADFYERLWRDIRDGRYS